MSFGAYILNGFTVAINFTAGGAGDTTVRTVVPGKKFVVFYLHLECNAAIDLIIKSGATEITGAIALTGTQVYDFDSSGAPILKGASDGDDLVFNVSGAADVDGWAYIAEIDS